MMRNEIVPAIRRIVGYNFAYTWFQQDGAGPHYSRGVRNFLDTEIFNWWIGRRGQIEWAPCSPDLSPLNYFLWDYLKGKVYVTKPRNLEELRQGLLKKLHSLLQNSSEMPYPVFMIE